MKKNPISTMALGALGFAVVCGLSACGGSGEANNQRVFSAAPPQAAPAANDVQVFAGNRSNYSITTLSVGVIVTDNVGTEGSLVVKGKKQLKFADVTVNLEIGDLANSISVTDLRSIIELYTAFFNRVPDADGLAYWIKQYKNGASLDSIADSFYGAAIYYSSLTGYTSTMSNRDFVLTIYKNVLGRSGVNAPPQADVDYWVDQLVAGTSKGNLIRTMLSSARTFYNDSKWSFVPLLLDGKLRVSTMFAVYQGLNYITPEDSIKKTMAIAAAVKQTGTADAEKLLPSHDNPFSLSGSPNYQYLSEVCTPEAEKNWARGHLDDVYLWYKDIQDVSSKLYTGSSDYFTALLVRSKDRFSFTSPQADIDGYFQSGTSFSYGYTLLREGTRLRVVLVEPGSPADKAGLLRGATIAQIDGTSLAQPANDVQYASLYPSKAETHSFDIVDVGATTSHTISMTAASITKSPVLTSKVMNIDGKKFGYMVFNDHIATAEQPLIDAMTNFKQAGVDELVLDLRYNGGGYLYIADEVAAMIGGSRTADQIFETLQYNDKHPTSDNDTSWFYAYDTKSRALPWLNMSRVFVLTSSRTCSASESIINGLSPFVQVILIGENTCGKPYGFRQTNNCKTAYFAISFSGVNSAGNGDYVNGFAPQCRVPEDLDHALGDPLEKRFSAAISYSKTGSCPAATGFQSLPPPKTPSEPDPYPWRSIRLVK